ncbi:S41 family peptidase [Dokdonia sp. Hel_I_53]|uniref:S41 family peptidase n=1 Tax=Dokdonia sp. Hel_I_53 TaxID=1566287 RepID=UPI00119A99FD|nr:S41 family peptidase [Dokdonia sp. Hel_I_53]TVZ51626.1 peptidase S41-like protein [Dokdonia sp. Hel_I_53]
MKTFTSFFIAFICLLSSFAKANNPYQKKCNCKEDLIYIDSQIRKMVSFKKQIKGDLLYLYDSKLDSLKLKITPETTVVACYNILNELLATIKDKHAAITHKEPKYLKNNLIRQDSITHFINSKIFKSHPTTSYNILELLKILENKSFTDFEGIYKLSESIEIGITAVQNGFEGVVTNSTDPLWAVGQIKYYFTKVGKNMYDVTTIGIPGGTLVRIPAMYYYDGRIWNLTKEGTSPHTHIKKEKENWEFRQLTEDTQYVYFGSFSNRKDNVLNFEKFYDETKDKFTAENIIVDLRDNGGGNSKYSDPFYKIFKKNKMNVYIITNFLTISNAEQFTLKLKKLKNSKHLGQRTYGAIAYGSNYGRTLETPSKCFSIYPTDMNFHKYIDYEYVGIQPEITLNFEEDWIEQTLKIINKKNY